MVTLLTNTFKQVSLLLQSEDDVDTAQKTVTLKTETGGTRTERYDLLVGADGASSRVRRAIIKTDNRMASQLSYVAPMRYVGVQGLRADAGPWGSADAARVVEPPLDTLREPPSIETAGARLLVPARAGVVNAQMWPV